MAEIFYLQEEVVQGSSSYFKRSRLFPSGYEIAMPGMPAIRARAPEAYRVTIGCKYSSREYISESETRRRDSS